MEEFIDVFDEVSLDIRNLVDVAELTDGSTNEAT